MLNRKAKPKPINPYESLEDVSGHKIDKVTVGKEIVYQLTIHFQKADSVCIDIPAITAHTAAAHEMLQLIMHTLGWRKESI